MRRRRSSEKEGGGGGGERWEWEVEEKWETLVGGCLGPREGEALWEAGVPGDEINFPPLFIRILLSSFPPLVKFFLLPGNPRFDQGAKNCHEETFPHSNC